LFYVVYVRCTPQARSGYRGINTIAHAARTLGYKLYPIIAKDFNTRNFVYSPVSLVNMLVMLREIAYDDTRVQIDKTLDLPLPPACTQEQLRNECATLNTWFQRTSTPHTTFRSYSALFACNENRVGEGDFRGLLNQAYACEVVKGPFDLEEPLRAAVVNFAHKEPNVRPIIAPHAEVSGAGLPRHGNRQAMAVVNGTYAVLELMAPFQEFCGISKFKAPGGAKDSWSLRPQLGVNMRGKQYDGSAASPFPGVPLTMFSMPLLPIMSVDALQQNIRPIAVEMLVLWPHDVNGLRKLDGLLQQNWQTLRTCVEQFQTTATLEPSYVFFPSFYSHYRPTWQSFQAVGLPDLFSSQYAVLGDTLGVPNYVRWFNQYTSFGIDDTAIRPNPTILERLPRDTTQYVPGTPTGRVIVVDSPFLYIVHAAELGLPLMIGQFNGIPVR
jgi:hypothetical protein